MRVYLKYIEDRKSYFTVFSNLRSAWKKKKKKASVKQIQLLTKIAASMCTFWR